MAAIVAGWKRHAGNRPGTANRGRMLLDVSWRQPEVTNVSLGERGADRVIVPLRLLQIVKILGGACPGAKIGLKIRIVSGEKKTALALVSSVPSALRVAMDG